MLESNALRRSSLNDHEIARFWSKVHIPDGRAYGPKGACWEWTGHRMPRGYGTFTGGDPRRRILVHRFAYAFFNGEARAGVIVRHTCDKRPCCQPGHLLGGSEAQNRAEQMERGRRASSPLGRADVLEIRRRASAGMPAAILAHDFLVSESTIYNILARRTWGDVTEEL